MTKALLRWAAKIRFLYPTQTGFVVCHMNDNKRVGNLIKMSPDRSYQISVVCPGPVITLETSIDDDCLNEKIWFHLL